MIIFRLRWTALHLRLLGDFHFRVYERFGLGHESVMEASASMGYRCIKLLLLCGTSSGLFHLMLLLLETQ